MTRTDAEWTKLVRGWQAHPPSWPKDAGPPPGAIDCLMPQHLLPPHLRRKGPPKPNGHAREADAGTTPPASEESVPPPPPTPLEQPAGNDDAIPLERQAPEPDNDGAQAPEASNDRIPEITELFHLNAKAGEPSPQTADSTATEPPPPEFPDSAGPSKLDGAVLHDFWAHLPSHRYIFTPSGEMWPAVSVNSQIEPIPLEKNGAPVLDDKGKIKVIPPSNWLDAHRHVEQLTWAPGLPMIVANRLIQGGGWIEHQGASCYNLYKPPTIKHGNAKEANPWIDHVRKVYGPDADHIIAWLAQRVQHPEIKINHALVLGGPQGIGKDTLLEPVKYAVGPWNFNEASPEQAVGRFKSFLKSVILRLNEASDLGDVDRYKFYDAMKTCIAAPPDVLRIDEKFVQEYNILNVVGIIITSNHKTDGIYLPADDRRHYVAWSDLSKDNFTPDYWNRLWQWYANGGIGHVAAYLATLDISGFDPKKPPSKTPAFWAIVDTSRAPENDEFADVLDALGMPDAVTIARIISQASPDFQTWLRDRKNRRAISHRMTQCGYERIRNDSNKDGVWIINRQRQVVYAKAELSIRDRFLAARKLTDGGQ
jgi:hypothetical protein